MSPRLASACLDGIAAAVVALVPFWWHLSVVESDVPDLTAVFGTVAVYPSDVCLAVLALGGVAVLLLQPRRTGWSVRWLALGVAALPCAALLSVVRASEPVLAASVAGHLALLALAWLGVGFGFVSARWLALGLVTSGGLQAALALAQFVTQQPLVPPGLELPWLPSADTSLSGAPVVLDPQGERLLRAFGTFPHPNILGGYLALALVMLPLLVGKGGSASLGRPGGQRKAAQPPGEVPQFVGQAPGLRVEARASPDEAHGLPGQARWVLGEAPWFVLGVLLTGGLVVSFSRAAWLAAAVGLVVWWLTSTRPQLNWRWILVGLALGLAGLMVSPVGNLIGVRLSPRPTNELERGSIEQRLALDRLALTVIRRHPLLGVGAGNFGLATLEEGLQAVFGEPAHSVPLLVIAELGVPGALAGLGLVLGIASLARRDLVAIGPALAACCAAGVLMVLDHYLWTMPPGRVMAWAPLALLAAVGVRMAPYR